MAQHAARKASEALAGRFRRDADGSVSVEYAMIGLIVAIMLIPALMGVQAALRDMPALHQIADVLTNGVPPKEDN